QMMINLLKISTGVILLVSIVVISNTIKLTIYTCRELIKTLQLLGATKMFIKVPFILEGIFQSIIGASLAFFTIFGLMKAGNHYLPQLVTLRIQLDLYFGIGLLIISVVIGFIGSYRAVSRFL
ncbi:MAG TPA: FtsX-like permease family protein, partial [Candidatus Marinimicrobia bacterium]|nr:FtsX-like permease family protein [Candidatus Neomarinimicrobiota bacterium]